MAPRTKAANKAGKKTTKRTTRQAAGRKPKGKRRTVKVTRDSRSGQFVDSGEATRRPATTQVETVVRDDPRPLTPAVLGRPDGLTARRATDPEAAAQ